MASLRISPNSKFWIACFTDSAGIRTQKSTKVPIDGFPRAQLKGLQNFFIQKFKATLSLPDSQSQVKDLNRIEAKRLAQRIADHFEEAARAARAGQLTERQARKVISEIYAKSNQDALSSSTIRDFCRAWLQRKELESNGRTAERYKTAIEHFLDFMGARANRDLAHLSAKEITQLRDHLAQALSPSSANFTVKVVRAALNQARRDGLTDTNEASRVSLLQNGQKLQRRPFTTDELKAVLDVADEEWRGMILVGLYTGLRIGDIAVLTWGHVDLKHEEVSVATQKTGRRQVIPLAGPVMRHLSGIPTHGDPNSPLFPRAAACRGRNRHGGALSNQFYDILVKAGLAQKRDHKGKGKGRDAKRQLNVLSFHSLRHTATSMLKNAGVSDVVARDIIGHDSEAVSQNYTHIDVATKRAAIAKLPDIFA